MDAQFVDVPLFNCDYSKLQKQIAPPPDFPHIRITAQKKRKLRLALKAQDIVMTPRLMDRSVSKSPGLLRVTDYNRLISAVAGSSEQTSAQSTFYKNHLSPKMKITHRHLQVPQERAMSSVVTKPSTIARDSSGPDLLYQSLDSVDVIGATRSRAQSSAATRFKPNKQFNQRLKRVIRSEQVNRKDKTRELQRSFDKLKPSIFISQDDVIKHLGVRRSANLRPDSLFNQSPSVHQFKQQCQHRQTSKISSRKGTIKLGMSSVIQTTCRPESVILSKIACDSKKLKRDKLRLFKMLDQSEMQERIMKVLRTDLTTIQPSSSFQQVSTFTNFEKSSLNKLYAESALKVSRFNPRKNKYPNVQIQVHDQQQQMPPSKSYTQQYL